MADLLIEIGNTALKAAWSEGTTLGKTFRYQGEKKIDFIISLTAKDVPSVMVVASVYDITPSEEKRLARHCHSLIVLDKAHSPVPGMPAHLTTDRAAALKAAGHLFHGKGCTVIDFGTTLTMDFIDAQGEYEGGLISLGCRTRFKALNRYSKALPLLDTPLDPPISGNSIKEGMEAGVISGIMFEIQGHMALHPDNVVVFTGGDANYFAKRMKNSIFVVCNLVLMGLAIIKEEYVIKDNA